MRIAWFTTADSESTQSRGAYFTKLVLPHIEKKAHIEIFGPINGRATHFLNAVEIHRKKPFDLFFYQLEDGRNSYFSRMHLALVPGVVLFHDLYFSDDGPEPMLNSPWEVTIRKFENRNIPWPAREQEHYREKPLGVREAGMAAVPVFTSERDHSEYKRRIHSKLRSGSSYYVPFPILAAHPSDQDGRAEVLFCGSSQVEDRAHIILQALSRVKKNNGAVWNLTWLLDDTKAERMRAHMLLSEYEVSNVKLEFGKSPEKWQNLLADSHRNAVAIHARVSALGHLQPYLNMSLGAGLKTICFRYGEEFPEKLVFGIDPGFGEAQSIETLLHKFADPNFSWNLEGQVEYINENYDPNVIAQELMSVFIKSAKELRPFYEQWAQFELEARASLLSEITIAGDPLHKSFTELGWV